MVLVKPVPLMRRRFLGTSVKDLPQSYPITRRSWERGAGRLLDAAWLVALNQSVGVPTRSGPAPQQCGALAAPHVVVPPTFRWRRVRDLWRSGRAFRPCSPTEQCDAMSLDTEEES